MADIAPNLELQKKRIQVRISEMQLSLSRSEVRKMEMAEEEQRINDNINATNLEILKLQDQLKQVK